MKEPMSPLTVVQTFIRSLEKCDFDAACALLSEDCEYDNVPMGKVFGRAAIRASLEPFMTPCSEVEWVTTREAETGPVVFNERVDRFKMAHGWVEIPVTGVWEVHSGTITLWRDYFDLATFRNQMPSS
jgi:limonene-1,2-epoxide hydrolase